MSSGSRVSQRLAITLSEISLSPWVIIYDYQGTIARQGTGRDIKASGIRWLVKEKSKAPNEAEILIEKRLMELIHQKRVLILSK